MFVALCRQTASDVRGRSGSAGSAFLLLLLLLSAYLMALAVAVPEYPWLGWVMLFPLLGAIQILQPLRAGLFHASPAQPRAPPGPATV